MRKVLFFNFKVLRIIFPSLPCLAIWGYRGINRRNLGSFYVLWLPIRSCFSEMLSQSETGSKAKFFVKTILASLSGVIKVILITYLDNLTFETSKLLHSVKNHQKYCHFYPTFRVEIDESFLRFFSLTLVLVDSILPLDV